MPASLLDLSKRVVSFRDARDWKQFHNPKDMALSLALETAEVMEHFQWKNADEMAKHIESARTSIGEELADELYWVLLMSHDFGVDIEQAFMTKIEKNEQKYPVDKAKGNHKKYTEHTI